MQLKEKFNKVGYNEYGIDVNKCEQIADDYAIDFAYWITDSENNNVKGSISIEELLEIFKKENK